MSCTNLASDQIEKSYMIMAKDVISDVFRHSILKHGPHIAGTRSIKLVKGKWIIGEPKGYIENYDGRITHYDGESDYIEKLELERARWHYWKSFEPYGFGPDEWK